MSSDFVIEVDQLSKSYRNGWWKASKFEALADVSLRVRRGEIFGLLGPNGAGKTTFVKILLGIIRKSAGAVKLLGYSAGSHQARRDIGYLPEQLSIAPHHTACSALEYYAGLSNVPAARVRRCRDELLAKVGLEEWCHVSVTKFSKGMVQRLGLAQALLHQPQLLILDEPTDGLDPIWRSQMRTILTELREQGQTIFVNSHLLQEVEMVCDRVAILDQGKLRYLGTIEAATNKAQSGASGKLELELVGLPSNIREVIGEDLINQWNQKDANCCTVLLDLPEQQDVDRCVDKLRSNGISIVRLARLRASLEDAFLSILSEPFHHDDVN